MGGPRLNIEADGITFQGIYKPYLVDCGDALLSSIHGNNRIIEPSQMTKYAIRMEDIGKSHENLFVDSPPSAVCEKG